MAEIDIINMTFPEMILSQTKDTSALRTDPLSALGTAGGETKGPGIGLTGDPPSTQGREGLILVVVGMRQYFPPY